MKCAFLIFTAISISTVTTDNFIPNRLHQQITQRIQTVVQQYYTRGRTVLVSMPGDEQHTGRSPSPPPYDNYRALVCFTLTMLREEVSWPLRLFPPEISLNFVVETPHSYIILYSHNMKTLKS
jgi:hypothetical protein